MEHHTVLRQDLMEAWERYLNKTGTRDDLALILDSFADHNALQEFDEVANREWNRVMNNIQPTPEEKELYRKEFSQLIAEYEKTKTRTTQSAPKANPEPGSRNPKHLIRFRKIGYAAAAALLLGMLIPAIYYLIPKNEPITVQYAEATTFRGEIRTILLPDSSMVTLNAESILKYPENFSDAERSVELYGEALFEVTSDAARPFTVKTENMSIRVLGTVFDVKAYKNDMFSSVSVVSGKVEVDMPDHKISLEKNHQVKIDKATGNFERLTIDADSYLSWTDGTLYFYFTPIHEVVHVLNRHFPQVDIKLAEGNYSNLISGKFESVYTAEKILKSIVFITGLKCKKTDENNYTLYHEDRKTAR